MKTCADCKIKKHCRAWMLIAKERAEQDIKHPDTDHTDQIWLSILVEEVGELAQEINEVHFNNKPSVDLLNELIQVAAVAKRWLECRLKKDKYLCKFFTEDTKQP